MDLSPAMLSGFADELAKIAASHGRAVVSKGRKGIRSISAAKLLANDRAGKLWKRKHAGAYSHHTALNLGQAAHDLRYLADHPDADRVAPKGSAHHLAASVAARVPSLSSNLYYAALPPQLHHTEGELAHLREGTHGAWLRAGYDPDAPMPAEPKSKKAAAEDWIMPAGAALGLGTGFTAAMLAAGPRGRKQIKEEIHDPRLYSNLRGAAALESAKERVAAHKDLDRSKDHSVFSAMREGFTRGGRKKHADSAGAPADVRGDAGDDPSAAQPPHRKGETPTKGDDNISVSMKTGSVPGAQSQTSPILSGEDARGVVASKPRMPGDVPTQEVAVDQPQGRIEPRAITFDTSAKRIRRGETPTRTDDMNKVDRADMRDNTTTVTGLGQGSTGIGAFNAPAEHA